MTKWLATSSGRSIPQFVLSDSQSLQNVSARLWLTTRGTIEERSCTLVPESFHTRHALKRTAREQARTALRRSGSLPFATVIIACPPTGKLRRTPAIAGLLIACDHRAYDA